MACHCNRFSIAQQYLEEQDTRYRVNPSERDTPLSTVWMGLLYSVVVGFHKVVGVLLGEVTAVLAWCVITRHLSHLCAALSVEMDSASKTLAAVQEDVRLFQERLGLTFIRSESEHLQLAVKHLL